MSPREVGTTEKAFRWLLLHRCWALVVVRPVLRGAIGMVAVRATPSASTRFLVAAASAAGLVREVVHCDRSLGSTEDWSR
jgi:hypothetical protein